MTFLIERGGAMTGKMVRATVLGAVGTLLMAVLTVHLIRTALTAWPGREPAPVEVGLGFLAAGAGALVSAWVCVLLAGATATLLASAPCARPTRDTGPPALVARRDLTGRVAALLLVAASLGAAPAAAEQVHPAVVVAPGVLPSGAPEQAGPAPGEEPVPVPVPGWSPTAPVPGWTPTPNLPEPARRAVAEVGLVSTTVASAPVEEVVVRRGDTLWSIAARHLGEQATDQDVAEAWPRWYSTNRDVIGGDPDLIVPGQRLVVPATGDAR